MGDNLQRSFAVANFLDEAREGNISRKLSAGTTQLREEYRRNSHAAIFAGSVLLLERHN